MSRSAGAHTGSAVGFAVAAAEWSSVETEGTRPVEESGSGSLAACLELDGVMSPSYLLAVLVVSMG